MAVCRSYAPGISSAPMVSYRCPLAAEPSVLLVVRRQKQGPGASGKISQNTGSTSQAYRFSS